MTRRTLQTVLAGFELGTGEPVSIPIAHTFITGMTQLSGKTTALRAIVMRSGRRALAFVTKRGEEFEGRRIAPFLPREGDRPIHWKFVETILASALGQRSMKYERYWIMNAAKNARTLEDVRRNVDRLKIKAKKGQTAETYELIGEYLDLVLPEMRELNASDTLDLQPGLNVIDIAGHSSQLQAMVIRACLEQINLHESEVLTVFPEAWEFAPRGRKTPASDEAVAMARKGAVLGNLLLCDSQDIAGVDTTVRQAASVWILGVQRELNELKRTLQMIPAGIKKPKAADVTSLKLGQFIICWSDHAIRTYVQPAWMTDEADAQAIAMGKLRIDDIFKPPPADIASPELRPASTWRGQKIGGSSPAGVYTTQTNSDVPPAGTAHVILLFVLKVQINHRKEYVDRLEKMIGGLAGSMDRFMQTMAKQNVKASGSIVADGKTVHRASSEDPHDENGDDVPTGPAHLQVNTTEPVLRVNVAPRQLEEEENSARGRVAILIADGFFAEAKIGNEAFKYWKARGFNQPSTRIYEALASLTKDGFLIMNAKKEYQQHPLLSVSKNGSKRVSITINYK